MILMLSLASCTPTATPTPPMAVDRTATCPSAHEVAALWLPDEPPAVCPPSMLPSTWFTRRVGTPEGELPPALRRSPPREPLPHEWNLSMLANVVADLQLTTAVAGLTQTPPILAERAVVLQDLSARPDIDPELVRAHACAAMGQLDDCTLTAAQCLSHLRVDQVAGAVCADPHVSLPYRLEDSSWPLWRKIVEDW